GRDHRPADGRAELHGPAGRGRAARRRARRAGGQRRPRPRPQPRRRPGHRGVVLDRVPTGDGRELDRPLRVARLLVVLVSAPTRAQLENFAHRLALLEAELAELREAGAAPAPAHAPATAPPPPAARWVPRPAPVPPAPVPAPVSRVAWTQG